MIEGQLSSAERRHIARALKEAEPKPKVCLEVGTWLGGGSTLHILRALEENGAGYLWGIEADRTFYERMVCNIAAAFPEGAKRFSPLFGFSQAVIPQWLKTLSPDETVDFVFLDGGDNPREQIIEFHLLNSRMTVGSQLMSHDARRRKGKWLVPYVSLLDNWQSSLLPESEYGLFHARKIKTQPSARSRIRAELCLLRLRLHPVEIAALVLPHAVRSWIAQLSPRMVNWYHARGARSVKKD